MQKKWSTQNTTLPVAKMDRFPQEKWCQNERKENIERSKLWPRWDSKLDGRKTQRHTAIVINLLPKLSLKLTKFIPPSSCANFERYDRKTRIYR